MMPICARGDATHASRRVPSHFQSGQSDLILCSTSRMLTSCSGLAHRAWELAVAEIHCRTLDCIASFVNNQAEASVLKKER
jgi:hypothetical protein